MKKKLLFVYNPRSGKAKIRNKLLDIVDVFIREGYEVRIHSTQGKRDALQVIKNREKGIYDRGVCSGGDGTLDEVVTGMMESGEWIPIGYIPAGSTNDFARSLGLSFRMAEAAKDCIKGQIFRCDIGKYLYLCSCLRRFYRGFLCNGSTDEKHVGLYGLSVRGGKKSVFHTVLCYAY